MTQKNSLYNDIGDMTLNQIGTGVRDVFSNTVNNYKDAFETGMITIKNGIVDFNNKGKEFAEHMIASYKDGCDIAKDNIKAGIDTAKTNIGNAYANVKAGIHNTADTLNKYHEKADDYLKNTTLNQMSADFKNGMDTLGDNVKDFAKDKAEAISKNVLGGVALEGAILANGYDKIIHGVAKVRDAGDKIKKGFDDAGEYLGNTTLNQMGEDAHTLGGAFKSGVENAKAVPLLSVMKYVGDNIKAASNETKCDIENRHDEMYRALCEQFGIQADTPDVSEGEYSL